MPSDDRSERLLALLLLQELRTQSQPEKVLQLSIAGFTNTEIADLMNTTANVVGQALFQARRKPKKIKQKRSKK